MPPVTARTVHAATVAFIVSTIVAFAPAAEASTFSCAGGDVNCLIDAILAANADGGTNTIHLSAGIYTVLSPAADDPPLLGDDTGLPRITSQLTIRGDGAGDTIIERPAQAPVFRLFTVENSLSLERVTVRGGGGDSSVSRGGAIFVLGSLTLTDSIVSGNRAMNGGGIAIWGQAVISNSSIVGNRAVEGAGIFVQGGELRVENSTIASNLGQFGGGATVRSDGAATFINCTFTANSALLGTAINEGLPGDAPVLIPPEPGTVTVQNSTIAANHISPIPAGRIINSRTGTIRIGGTIMANNEPPERGDCPQTFTSLGFNLIRNPFHTSPVSNPPPPSDCLNLLQATGIVADPLLANFADDGTPGHGYFPLSPGSPAIDAGNDAACSTPDQRGRPRPADGNGDGVRACDIGAVEFYPVVDDLVQLETVSARFIPPPSNNEPAPRAGGHYEIDAVFTNGTGQDICKLSFDVTTLRGASDQTVPVMLAADGRVLGGEGAIVPATLAGGVVDLKAHQQQQYRFTIGVRAKEGITFFVNLLGEATAGACTP